jgi:hypothetical protein
MPFFRMDDPGYRIRKVDEIPKEWFDNFGKRGDVVGTKE